MTISTTRRTRQYNGNASTTAFAYDFNIQAEAEIEVYLGTPVGAPTSWALQSLTTHYSISNVGVAGGGEITFGSPPPSGTGNVFIRRVTAKTQTSDYVENDPFSADTVEGNLDKLTQITQDMQEEIDRCFKLGTIVPDVGVTAASSVVADRANKLFAFDASGDFSVTNEIGTVKGNWAASTAYVLRDIVKDTNNNNIYICIVAHTSSGSVPISSNTDAAKWSLLVDAASATTSAAAAASSATAAASSATAAAASASTSTAQAVIATAKAVLTASDATDTAADLVETAADVVLAEAAKVAAVAATGASAFKYTFDNSTTMADPGTAGEIRYNHGTVGSVSALAIRATSADTGNPDISPFIASWDDGTNSAHEGFITIRKSGTPATYAVFALTGAVVDNTAWLQLPVTHVSSNGSWSNADTLYISFTRSGQLGATGSQGVQGDTGVTGAQGPTGVSAGLPFRFNSATTDSDKDAGDFWYNNSVGSATIVYLDNADSDGNAVSAITDTWDDGGSATHRGFLFVKQDADPSNMASFKVTGSIVDASGYSKVTVALLGAYGTISNNDLCHLEFSQTGTGGIANRTVDTMTGDASDTTLALSQSPGSENNVSITFDGVMQHHDTYSLSGSTITFSTAPATGVKVEAVSGGLESIGTPSNGTVTLAKMAVNSIDSDQYVDGSIDLVHLSADCVDGTKIADDAINSEHYAAASIDAEHLAVGKDGALSLDATPDTDHTANGPQTSTLNAGYSSTIMDLVYLNANGKWLEADADATGTSINLLGIAMEAKTDGQAMNVALAGSFVRDDTWNWTIGVPLYVSGTLGAITATKPSGSGDIVRTVGYAVTADVIFFNPSSDYVTLA